MIRGHAVAGASAILWGPPGDGGHRAILARVCVALPNEPHAQAAEAAGCAAGLRILLGIPDSPRAARIAGDNAAVVRHGAGIGRLSRPGLHALLAAPLAAATERGWDLTWIPIRRRPNYADDAIATSAVQWAAQLRPGGLSGMITAQDTV